MALDKILEMKGICKSFPGVVALNNVDLDLNKDGSVDLYFGPKPPKKGSRKNWTKTVPGEGWFTYFRLYAPTQPYFDKTWQLPDIKKVK